MVRVKLTKLNVVDSFKNKNERENMKKKQKKYKHTTHKQNSSIPA
jgi:hypothetical protein